MTAAAIASDGAEAADLNGNVVSVTLRNGRTLALYALALRDLCPCSDCRHPVSGQRLFESGQVLPGTRARSVAADEGALLVEWHGGHSSTFSVEALGAAAAPPPAAPEPILWDAQTGSVPRWHAWESVSSSQTALADFLRDGAVFGFALLRGVTRETGAVAAVAELFGAVRQTNYGRIFDVRVSVDATNLADTSLPLSPHTDNPYRRPTPTLQLLHCLETKVDGGETVLVDGFAAVARLAAHEPAGIEALASMPIRFAYQDADANLATDVPVVTLAANGKPVAIHINNRSKGAPCGLPEEVAAWYKAYLDLLAVIDDPAQQIVLRLESGDLVLLDNERVLHGRTGFVGAGARHLQGCYADRDGLLSALGVLER